VDEKLDRLATKTMPRNYRAKGPGASSAGKEGNYTDLKVDMSTDSMLGRMSTQSFSTPNTNNQKNEGGQGIQRTLGKTPSGGGVGSKHLSLGGTIASGSNLPGRGMSSRKNSRKMEAERPFKKKRVGRNHRRMNAKKKNHRKGR